VIKLFSWFDSELNLGLSSFVDLLVIND